MQRVELQPAAGVPDRAVQLASRDAGGDQPLQAPGEQLLQLLPHRRLPVLEVRAVAHGEACEEVVPVQADAALQRGGVLAGQQGLELAHVDVDRRGHQPDGRSRDHERRSHGRGRHRQGAPERPARLGLVGVRPQQVGDLFPGVLAAGDREQREQRDGFPGVERNRRAVTLDHRRPEQGQAQLVHAFPPPTDRIITVTVIRESPSHRHAFRNDPVPPCFYADHVGIRHDPENHMPQRTEGQRASETAQEPKGATAPDAAWQAPAGETAETSGADWDGSRAADDGSAGDHGGRGGTPGEGAERGERDRPAAGARATAPQVAGRDAR